MKRTLLEVSRESSLFMATVSWIVIFIFLWVQLYPTARAVEHVLDEPTQGAVTATDEGKLSKAIEKAGDKLEKIEEKLEAAEDAAQEVNELAALHAEISDLDVTVTENFQQIEAHIHAEILPDVMLQRHLEMVANYRQQLSEFLLNLESIELATTTEERKLRVRSTRDHLESMELRPAPRGFDPGDLPNKSWRPIEGNKPKTKKEDFSSAGLYGNPTIKLAALGDFAFDTLPDASNPAYLAETVEVRLSDSIRAKAAELEHDPVKIYNWVRNNTEWTPTWGAMQNSDHTLSSKEGNAFDIVSLHIALLRASGIPARYVHGTIEISADKFKNWAGGFTDIIAAGEFAASGGIPLVGVTIGGEIRSVRMEHIWVEAAIDYEPSRGAVNRDADTWIQIDPSFKQYEFLTGADPVALSGTDPEAVQQSFRNSGIVNESESWVSGFDLAIVQGATLQLSNAMIDYANGLTDPTVVEVFGGRKIIVAEVPVLPSAVPNPVIVDGVRYGEIPESLQHKVSFAFQTDFFTGDLINPISFPWPQVNNEKITVSFRPATVDDEQTLLSFVPQGDPATIDPNSVTIPAYLVNVVPELKLNGETVMQGAPMRLGQSLPFTYAMDSPGRQTLVTQSPTIAGSYVSVAAIGGSIARARMLEALARLESTKEILETNDPALAAGIGSDQLGDVFYAGVLRYFAEYLTTNRVGGLREGNRLNLAPSMGTYGYVPNVASFFGVPRTVSPGLVIVDLPRIITVAENIAGDDQKRFDFVLQAGVLGSALEHITPEDMFSTDDARVDAISAVKALGRAHNEGQRIFLLTKENQDLTLPNLNHDSTTLGAIRQALAAGKQVITHTDRLFVPGWSGFGYIVFDPVVGDGGYIISGGANGAAAKIVGNLLIVLGFLMIFGGLLLSANILYFGAALALIVAGIITIGLGLSILNDDPAYLLFSIGLAFWLLTAVLTLGGFAGVALLVALVGLILVFLLDLVLGILDYRDPRSGRRFAAARQMEPEVVFA